MLHYFILFFILLFINLLFFITVLTLCPWRESISSGQDAFKGYNAEKYISLTTYLPNFFKLAVAFIS